MQTEVYFLQKQGHKKTTMKFHTNLTSAFRNITILQKWDVTKYKFSKD